LWKVRYSLVPFKEILNQPLCTADYDYIFADDEREANPTSFKFLQMAHAWAATKKAGLGGAGSGGGGGGGGGGALSRFSHFTAAPEPVAQDDQDNDSHRRTGSDGGENESVDEDMGSVASSQGES